MFVTGEFTLMYGTGTQILIDVTMVWSVSLEILLDKIDTRGANIYLFTLEHSPSLYGM